MVPGHWQQLTGLDRHIGKVLYRCHFAHDIEHSALVTRHSPFATRYWLRVNGAFYWSQPYLNGVDLGRHEGYFIPYEREVTGLLEAENTLLVEVECPDEERKVGKRLITGVFSHWDGIDPETNPGGIWLPVELHQSGPVRLGQVRCHTEAVSDDFAQLRFWAPLDSALAADVTLHWEISPLNFAAPVQRFEQRRRLAEGQQELSGFLKLRDPRLWWTHDLGEPNLYTISLEVLVDGEMSDRHSFTFGIRRFELRDWVPHLNGVRFLAKGNNYAPGDARIAVMTREDYDRDLLLARECHMNLLRVHAHVEHPAFYEAANAQGVLLWQDMPLQWLYQPAVLPEARRQTRAMVRLLYNHPSVAIWCMHNEALFVEDTGDESRLARWRTFGSLLGYNWNRTVLDTQLAQIAREEDPRRAVVRSSGELGIPGMREGTDSHAYFGWYASYGSLARGEQLLRRFPSQTRFVTEFGAQSFPNVESCLRFMPAEIGRIDTELLRRRYSFQPDIMANWVDWRAAGSLDELVRMTQDYQIFINRYYIDRLRVGKYRPTGGIVPFMFQDANPAITWSIVDYWRVPKRSYYAMALAFSPQYVCAIFDLRRYRVGAPLALELYAVNDAQRDVRAARFDAWLRDEAGRELAHAHRTIDLAADCMAFVVDRLRFTPRATGCYTLTLGLSGEGCSTVEHSYTIEVV
jgi:beta-mannosidase